MVPIKKNIEGILPKVLESPPPADAAATWDKHIRKCTDALVTSLCRHSTTIPAIPVRSGQPVHTTTHNSQGRACVQIGLFVDETYPAYVYGVLAYEGRATVFLPSNNPKSHRAVHRVMSLSSGLVVHTVIPNDDTWLPGSLFAPAMLLMAWSGTDRAGSLVPHLRDWWPVLLLFNAFCGRAPLCIPWDNVLLAAQ